MRTFVRLKNPRTNEVRTVKLGWSWTLFFFSSFLGIPLFYRKLTTWAVIFLVVWALNLLLGAIVTVPAKKSLTSTFFLLLMLGLSIWMGKKGNELTAKNYLEQGWEFLDPDTDVTKFAKLQWGLAPK